MNYCLYVQSVLVDEEGRCLRNIGTSSQISHISIKPNTFIPYFSSIIFNIILQPAHVLLSVLFHLGLSDKLHLKNTVKQIPIGLYLIRFAIYIETQHIMKVQTEMFPYIC
jgi:hypothetical protein